MLRFGVLCFFKGSHQASTNFTGFCVAVCTLSFCYQALRFKCSFKNHATRRRSALLLPNTSHTAHLRVSPTIPM